MKKKNFQKKKTKQSARTKKVESVSHSHEIIVRVEPSQIIPTAKELGDPMKDGGKYMIPKTWMSEKMALKLVQKTPPQYIYKRPGKGGGEFSYVTGSYVEKVLNYTFGWNWDFEIITHGKEDGHQVWVHGKLTVKDDQGHTITKSQFGRADIKYKKNSKEMLDFGNDLKAASTDSLKKCASLLGIASDVYGKTEFKQETGFTPIDNTPKPPVNKDLHYAHPEHIYECNECGEPITEQEANYSKKVYKKYLCRNHQKTQAK